MDTSFTEQGGNIDIGIIGAGISGIGAAIQLQRELQLNSFTIFDRNGEVGGSWLVNSYPGCRSDVESQICSFSFEPKPDYAKTYASRSEMLAYLRKVATKWEIYSRAKFNTEVKSLTWDEKVFKWILVYVDNQAQNGEEKTALFDIIINGAGRVSVPKVPTEYGSFTGPSMHSGEWDHSIDLKDRKVAVIGTGRSALQIIPNIVDDVKELHVYQRRAPYLTPSLHCNYHHIIIFLQTTFPIILWIVRAVATSYQESISYAFKPNTIFNKMANIIISFNRKLQIWRNEKLRISLTPDYSFGCKKYVTADDFYPTMALPRVHLHTSHIDKFIEQTIFTKDGKSQDIDVLIFATGFRVQDYFKPLVIIGADGVNILDSWVKNGPKAYYGITSHDNPNQFFLLGPNTLPGHNSCFFQIECQINFVLMAIQEMVQRKSRRVCVKASAEKDYMKTLNENLKETVWATDSMKNCGSWYADDAGRVTTQWPLTCFEYWNQTRKIDFQKFEFQS